MTQQKFNEAMRGRMNSIINLSGVKIRNRAWEATPWHIVAPHAREGNQEDFNNLPALFKFPTRRDLWNHLKAYYFN